MAARKYLNDSGLEHLSSYVNAKLTVVSTMPSAPTDLRTVLYIGETTEDYIQGGIYLYDVPNDEWILISTADVDLDDYETSWTGTLADWQALGSEQEKYKIVNITDDFVPGTSDHVVKGYYYQDKFYEDAEHTAEIAGVVGFIYIDLPLDDLYLYDDTNSEFVLAGGGGIDSIVWGYYYEGDFYEEAAHTTVITPSEGYLYVDLDGNSIYIYKTNAYVQISGSGSEYTAGFGISIEDNEISSTQFVGTQAEWDALTPTEQAAFDFINITDDTTAVVEGAPGHAISDETSEKAQRTGLKFEGFTVTDDSSNDQTKIAAIPYTAGDGIEIDANKEVATDPDLLPFTFVGTTAEWNGLTSAEKANYKLVSLTDDVAGGDMVVEDAVTENSVNPVTSGAVYDAINDQHGKIVFTSIANETYSQLLNRMFSTIDNLDMDILSVCAIHRHVTTVGDDRWSEVFRFVTSNNSTYYFTKFGTAAGNGSVNGERLAIKASGSTYEYVDRYGSNQQLPTVNVGSHSTTSTGDVDGVNVFSIIW